MHSKLTFEELKDIYSERKSGCGNGYYGKLYIPQNTESHKIIYPVIKYNYDNNYQTIDPGAYSIETNYTNKSKIMSLNCNSIQCKNCRKIIQSKLFNNCIREVNSHNIIYHLVSTFGDNRKKYNYEESYKLMSNDFTKLIQAINYAIYRINNGKELRTKNTFMYEGAEIPNYDFAYINFVRSQNHPTENNPIGFSHNHTGMNYNINKEWIDEICKKNKYKIGHTFITENNNFTEYLTGDFFDDEEWIIPINKKHYHTSQNLHLIVKHKKIDGSILFKNPKYKIIDEYLWEYNNEIMPLEEYIKWFYDVVDQKKKNEKHETSVFLNKFKDKGERRTKTGDRYYLNMIKNE